jgi:uncharacterized protein
MMRSILAALVLALGVPAAAQARSAGPSPSLLVYTKATGWRHDSIPAATAALADIARKRGWTLTLTEDPSWFEGEKLRQFDAAIWALPTGDTLSASQKAAFRSFIASGGAYVGLHSAGDSSHSWDWYAGELVGAKFTGHPGDPNVRTGTIRVENSSHPATRHLAPTWARIDEWYYFDRSVRDRFAVLASLDPSSVAPPLGERDASRLGNRADHPSVWHRCVGEGRAFYSALGHTIESYSEPDHLKMIEGAIAWALGEGSCPKSARE